MAKPFPPSLLLLATTAAVPGCDGDAVRYSVGGTASGVVGELVLSDGWEVIHVREDGAFSFPGGRSKGDDYAVTVVVPPVDRACTVENGVGTIGSSDVDGVVVTCRGDNVRLASLAVDPSVELLPAFDAEVAGYEALVFLFDSTVRVTATAEDPTATIRVQGQPAVSGAPSDPVDLDLGENVVSVELTAESGRSRLYEIRVRRGEPDYGKASNSGNDDRFGFSISSFGDFLVVGAFQEDSAATGVGGDPTSEAASNSGAVYVYSRIGDLWVQEAYLKASNAEAGDEFGRNIGFSDNTLVVGARLEDSSATGINGDQTSNASTDAGAVYVFVRSAGVWAQQAYLKASNTGGGDQFGSSVAINGDTLVVGSPLEDSSATGVGGAQGDNGASAAGAAYIFVRSGTTWTQQAYLKASNTGANDQFGGSVSLSGSTAVVGAALEDSSSVGVDGVQADETATNAGAAYVFNRNGTTWTQQGYLKASNTGANDQFGGTVDISGETVVVGAALEDSAATGVGGNGADNSASSSGASYVFTRTAGAWSPQAYVKASNAGFDDRFGGSLAIVGDLLVVGAALEDSSAAGIDGDPADDNSLESGAAYLFVREAGAWRQRAYLKSPAPGANDQFGTSVALAADFVIVAAPLEDSSARTLGTFVANSANNAALDSGAVYLFR